MVKSSTLKSMKSTSDEPEFKILPLNLLAFPRDFMPICEITGEKAKVQLETKFGIMYYVSEEAAEQAWFGIIKKIAHLLPPLMEEAPIIGSQEERRRREENIVLSKRSIIEFCLSEASNLLSVNKYDLSIPAAIQALKFSRDLDGDRAISTVDPLLQISQAYVGKLEVNKAEEYLSRCHWIVINTHCSDRLKSRMFLLIGRVKASKGDFIEAKKHFSSGIYFASKAFGAEAIATSFGYFRLGEVFLAQGSPETALDFYDKVVDIWYKYLTSLYNNAENKDSNGNTTSSLNPTKDRHNDSKTQHISQTEPLSEEQLSEGRNQLELILDNRKRLLGETHITIGESLYTMGLFDFFLLGNETSADNLLESALNSYELNYTSDHPSTKHVKKVFTLVRQGSISGSSLVL